MRVITDHKVARNPVARAIARTQVSKRLLHTKLQIYTKANGELCTPLLHDIGFVLTVMGTAGELDPGVGPDDRRVRIIRGALSAIDQMLPSGLWDGMQAVSLESGLTMAEELNSVVKTEYVLDAWNDMNKRLEEA